MNIFSPIIIYQLYDFHEPLQGVLGAVTWLFQEYRPTPTIHRSSSFVNLAIGQRSIDFKFKNFSFFGKNSNLLHLNLDKYLHKESSDLCFKHCVMYAVIAVTYFKTSSFHLSCLRVIEFKECKRTKRRKISQLSLTSYHRRNSLRDHCGKWSFRI